MKKSLLFQKPPYPTTRLPQHPALAPGVLAVRGYPPRADRFPHPELGGQVAHRSVFPATPLVNDWQEFFVKPFIFFIVAEPGEGVWGEVVDD